LTILVAIQAVLFFVWAIAFDGCTKYVPFAGVQALNRFVWQLAATSIVLNLVVLVFFLSDFFRRPGLLIDKMSVRVFACFAAWKIFAIAGDVQHASRCGQARDFYYPYRLSWIPSDLLFWGDFFAWLVMLGFVPLALGREPDIENSKIRLHQ